MTMAFKDNATADEIAAWRKSLLKDGDIESLKQIIAQQRKQNDDLYYQNSQMLRVLKYAASHASSPNFNAGNWIDMVVGITTRIEQGSI